MRIEMKSQTHGIHLFPFWIFLTSRNQNSTVAPYEYSYIIEQVNIKLFDQKDSKIIPMSVLVGYVLILKYQTNAALIIQGSIDKSELSLQAI